MKFWNRLKRARNDEVVRCSFCNKSQDEVDKLISTCALEFFCLREIAVYLETSYYIAPTLAARRFCSLRFKRPGYVAF